MSLYYSPSHGGFFDDHIHKDLPPDAYRISAQQHASLLEAQSKGLQIKANAVGAPIAAAPDPISREDGFQRLRWQRDKRLADCDYTQLADAPLTDDQRAAWATYRQALRDLPNLITDPADLAWPVPPVEG